MSSKTKVEQNSNSGQGCLHSLNANDFRKAMNPFLLLLIMGNILEQTELCILGINNQSSKRKIQML